MQMSLKFTFTTGTIYMLILSVFLQNNGQKQLKYSISCQAFLHKEDS